MPCQSGPFGWVEWSVRLSNFKTSVIIVNCKITKTLWSWFFKHLFSWGYLVIQIVWTDNIHHFIHTFLLFLLLPLYPLCLQSLLYLILSQSTPDCIPNPTSHFPSMPLKVGAAKCIEHQIECTRGGHCHPNPLPPIPVWEGLWFWPCCPRFVLAVSMETLETIRTAKSGPLPLCQRWTLAQVRALPLCLA